MPYDLGTVLPGSTQYIPFHTFDSNDPSASVTITGLAVTDIEIYKDGSVTQRASDAGYALLDTDGIDFDGVTGIHGFSLDLADNTTAGFFTAGARYWVVVSAITIDAATVNFVAATFRIGYPGALLDTTIATLASQTGFTLTAGSADNDAYNGWTAVVHDVASAIQVAAGIVSDYVGSTKTVTLSADPGIFTMAAGDNISLFPPVGVHAWNAVALATTNPLPNAAADAAGGLIISDAGGLDADAQIVTKINSILDDTDLIDDATSGLAKIATDVAAVLVDTSTTLQGELDGIQADTEDIQATLATNLDTTVSSRATPAQAADAVWNEATADWVGAGTFGKAVSDVLVDTAEIGTAGAGLTEAGGTGDHLTAINLPNQTMDITGDITGNLSGSVGSVTGNVGGTVAELGTQAKADVNAEVVDALATDTYAEPAQGAPAATASLATKIGNLHKSWRNKKDNDGTTTQLYNDDAATVDHKQTTSESGGTVTKGEWVTGP
jgi:hypothetical protein